MKLGSAFIAAAAAFACGAANAASLEAYGKLPIMSDVSISPDGSKVAFVQPVDGRQAVVIDQLNPAAIVAEVAPTDQKIRGLIWADDTHLLVIKSQSGFARYVQSGLSEWYLAYSYDLSKKKVTPLFGRPQDLGETSHIRGKETMNIIASMPEVRTTNGHVTILAEGVVFVDSAGVPALLSAELGTGTERIVENALQRNQSRSWVLDEQGAPIAQITYDQGTHDWILRLKREGKWVDTYSVKALNETPDIRGVSPDGRSLLLETVKTDGEVQTQPVSLADGKIGAVLTDYDAYTTLIRDPANHRVIGGVKQGLEPDYEFFDAKDQATWGSVTKAFPNERVDLASWSRDRQKMVVKVTGPLHGVVYAVVDLATRQVTPIGQAYEGITPDDVADVSIASYRAKDGAKIDAFLTLPTGREPKNLPLIVLPHGGPAARDEAGFDWWAQALASRGYAVLQPQFRGSADLGWPLESAGFGEFGRKMQSDLSDGVRALAASGYIDPKRVCIVGASYGGYAALAGTTLEQGVYRCAVAVAGVSDLRKMIGGSLADADKSSSVRWWNRFVGAKDSSDPLFDQISPLRHAAQANAPILLIHGKDDSVVPYEQSVMMESALKSAKMPVEFVTLDREDHWLSREATRMQMLQATVAFLEKHNPPK